MKYPKLLQPGDTIGVCAPSSGVSEGLYPRLDRALKNVRALGYNTIETVSVRHNSKCVSADAAIRAAEFMELYENPDVAAIIPPWGGEFLMDMLPYLDLARLSALPPKWISGFSDTTTLTFVLTVCCDVATVHGSALMDMGFAVIHESDLSVFAAMSKPEISQVNSSFWGKYSASCDIENPPYELTEKTIWKSLDSKERYKFEGRMIGGCFDVLSKLPGTKFAPMTAFLEKYKHDGFIWALESDEMNAAEIYRTLWQMRECGWFEYCRGFLIGRPNRYSNTRGFTLKDALEGGLGGLSVPVIYDADIGHVPPRIQIVNGAYGSVDFEGGGATVEQRQRFE